jgi:hypothetical protein
VELFVYDLHFLFRSYSLVLKKQACRISITLALYRRNLDAVGVAVSILKVLCNAYCKTLVVAVGFISELVAKLNEFLSAQ